MVGLFHMSLRDPATLPLIKQTALEYEEECADTADFDSFISASEEPTPEEVEKLGWLK